MFTTWVAELPFGRELLDQVRSANVLGATGWATIVVTTLAGTIARGFGYSIVVLFVAIYLAAQPERYLRLSLRMVPPAHRTVAQHLFDVAGNVLQRWLVGQLVVMLTVGALSGCCRFALHGETRSFQEGFGHFT